MTDTPCETHRYERFMPIVAVSFVFEADIGFVGSRCVTDRPILMKPPAVYGEGKRRCKQSVERRIDAVFRDIAALCWVIEIVVQREDRFVGDRRIVKSKCTREEAVPRDSVRINVGREDKPC